MNALAEGAMKKIEFQVDRSDFGKTEFAFSEVGASLAKGEIVLSVDRFALTSNNISYALTGDMLGYWGFFPARDGWGLIPAMGFGDVIRSANPEIAVGGRYFGFFPMSNLHVVAARVEREGFSDAGAHRSEHAAVYRRFSDVTKDALYGGSESEDAIMLLRGLFTTSFLVEDFVEDNARFGARALIISSASSKTSIALAHQAARRGHFRVIGLTSPGNAAFVEALGCYDEVCLYGDVSALERSPSVFVDMAGNARVVRELHERLGDELRHDCVVGATHWQSGGPTDQLPGPKRTFFFAPAQIAKRSQDWGAAGLQERLGSAWREFREGSRAWLEVVRGAGQEDVARVYAALLAGRVRPSEGHVLSLSID